MEILKSIYFEYSQTEDYARANKKYDKYYSAARDKFITAPKDEDVLVAAAAEQEMFGFMQGFKCAMQLKKECDTI